MTIIQQNTLINSYKFTIDSRRLHGLLVHFIKILHSPHHRGKRKNSQEYSELQNKGSVRLAPLDDVF